MGGHVSTVSLLLRLRAAIDAQNEVRRGETRARVRARHALKNCVGVGPLCAQDGTSALIAAVSNRHAYLAEYLCKMGAALNLTVMVRATAACGFRRAECLTPIGRLRSPASAASARVTSLRRTATRASSRSSMRCVRAVG